MKLKHMLRNYALYAPETGEGGGEVASEPTAEPTAEPTEPVAPTFTQEQVNALLAKERNVATRKAKAAVKAAQQPKQETTTDAGDDSKISALAESVQALTGLVQGTIDKQTASESAQAFAQDTAGLQISDTDKAVLKTLREHSPEVYAAKLGEYRAVDQPPQPKGEGLRTPGAPSATPNAPDMSSPTSWTKDDIAVMRKEGTFLTNLKKARNAMPGGGGGLFPAKNPAKG